MSERRMTATEQLRKLLDECGVEWYDDSESIYWDGIDGTSWTAERRRAGDLYLCSIGCTSEQAVAATLGQEDTYTREDVEGAFVSGYSLGCLPVGSDPQWDENRQTVDEHMAELGWVRKDAATLGRVTCKIHDCEGSFSAVNRPVWRCDCGAFMTQYTDATTYHKPRFCPNCGRRVIGPTTNEADTEVDANGMDTAGRGVCDCASADVPATGRPDDSGDCADNQGQVLTPITQELNERARKLGIEVDA